MTGKNSSKKFRMKLSNLKNSSIETKVADSFVILDWKNHGRIRFRLLLKSAKKLCQISNCEQIKTISSQCCHLKKIPKTHFHENKFPRVTFLQKFMSLRFTFPRITLFFRFTFPRISFPRITFSRIRFSRKNISPQTFFPLSGKKWNRVILYGEMRYEHIWNEEIWNGKILLGNMWFRENLSRKNDFSDGLRGNNSRGNMIRGNGQGLSIRVDWALLFSGIKCSLGFQKIHSKIFLCLI
jgi:hypothetical protein